MDVIEIIIVAVIVMLLQNVKGTRTGPSLSSTPARRTKEGRSSSATSGPSLKTRRTLTRTTSNCTMITMVKTLIIIRINFTDVQTFIIIRINCTDVQTLIIIRKNYFLNFVFIIRRQKFLKSKLNLRRSLMRSSNKCKSPAAAKSKS